LSSLGPIEHAAIVRQLAHEPRIRCHPGEVCGSDRPNQRKKIILHRQRGQSRRHLLNQGILRAVSADGGQQYGTLATATPVSAEAEHSFELWQRPGNQRVPDVSLEWLVTVWTPPFQ
jgi:hypothetical protein